MGSEDAPLRDSFRHPTEISPRDYTPEYIKEASKLCNVNGPRLDHPINCISQMQAGTFCKDRGARLPKVEEWEWAARSGSVQTKYAWGNEEPTTQPCWSGLAKRGTSCPVGSHEQDQNAFGVLDLGGNILEWTASDGPFGPGTRYVKGGSYGTTAAADLVATHWFDGPPDDRSNLLGFRCVQ